MATHPKKRLYRTHGGMMIDINWAEAFDWGCTNENHIWECVQTGMYHFSDEASLLDETPYRTITECLQALDNYVEQLG
jgi:hypothetical protein